MRRQPILTALRTTIQERAMIDEVASQEGMSVHGLLRSIVLPVIRRRVQGRNEAGEGHGIHVE